ncbi:selT-like protein [Nicotiana tabacum]|uniref:SelT-like protein n=2 Tax=Nicotiana TaxID=4085 RepID=A0A1S3YZH3_TOBAC|nr:PREDICTED: selT-like protein [Nicotiana sylvestris]XP_016457594.1 PREDICTED: selT-like protein [Nicotiana tabacum]
MDRTQLLLVGLPLFLFISDLFSLFTPPPQKPTSDHHHHQPPSVIQQQQPQTLDFPTQKTGGIGAVGIGNTVSIDFCSSCSFRGSAVTMKNMLENQFPGIHVVLANYPPPLPKRLLSKVVPVFQFGVIGLVMGGEQIFPRLGFAVPPPWFYHLRANRFGTMATTWLLGNFFQSMLQSSGAFEVYCNGELIFSKLKENRFPGEIELKDLVGRRIANPRVVDGLGASSWS